MTFSVIIAPPLKLHGSTLNRILRKDGKTSMPISRLRKSVTRSGYHEKKKFNGVYSYLPAGILSAAARLVPSRFDGPISSIEPLLLLHLFARA